jgi:hypothetical protein
MPSLIKLLLAFVMLGLSSPTSAQSTAGSIVGEAGAGDSVTIVGTSNGFKREVTVDKDGKYKARNIPIGSYNVILVRKDGAVTALSDILVHPGATTRIPAQANSAGRDPSAASPGI